MQIRYRARSSDGTIRAYGGIFLKVKESLSLFCCRKLQETEDSLALKSQIVSLKNMQELVMRFTDGIAAFEITEEGVTPLYASDNVCHFFGYTREEWLPMMKEKTSLAEFVSRGNITYEQVLEVFKNGEGEFSYFELETNRTRRIRAVCSQRTSDVSAPRYVMMYKVEEEAAGEQEKSSVHIRTFGYFDVFVDDRPIAFRSEKAKELFALLVDRRGGYVASDEAIGFLWPEEPANTVTLARYRKVALRLKNILEEHGIGDVVESVDGKRRIAAERVQCDLYDYLTGKEEFASLFKGSYLSNYSWGEITLGELLNSPLEEKSQVW